MCIFRSLSTADLENILQSWTSGKESGIWISVDIVIGLLPALSLIDFTSYMKLGYGQDALKRGFFAYEKDRKVDSVFVFDRANAEIDHSHGIKLSEPPNVRLWQRFLDIFQKLYEVDREAFLLRFSRKTYQTKEWSPPWLKLYSVPKEVD